jgi:hypothetical protein
MNKTLPVGMLHGRVYIKKVDKQLVFIKVTFIPYASSRLYANLIKIQGEMKHAYSIIILAIDIKAIL